MFPHERSLVQQLAGKPFALVGVNSDRSKEELKSVMAKEQITWRSFWDQSTTGEIARKFKVHGWPTLYVIDHKGAIRYKFVGSPGEQVLDQVIVKLLKEASSKN
jgi:thioredoxin-related protein